MTGSTTAKDVARAAAFIAGAIALRIVLEVFLWRSGWFFGPESDPFSRTYLAWRWASQPYFSPGHWLPLQFWIVGSVYRLLGLHTTALSIPVVLNHVYFLASLSLLYIIAFRQGGSPAAGLAVLLAATAKADVWITLNGLVEPLLIVWFMFMAALLQRWFGEASRGRRAALAPFLGLTALLGSATHYIGWSLSAAAAIPIAIEVVQCVRRGLWSRPIWSRLAAGLAAAVTFPVLWMAKDMAMSLTPLELLSRAARFHVAYAPSYSMLDRLVGPITLWLSTSPLLILMGSIGLAFLFRRRQSEVAGLVLPFALCLLLLEVSSAATWGMPYLYTRYTVVLTWGLLPFAAAQAVNAVRTGPALVKVIAVAAIVATTVIGVRDVFRFTNWITPGARLAGTYLAAALEGNPPVDRIVGESFGGWADRGLDVMAGRPDRFIWVPHGEDADATARGLLARCSGNCILVLRSLDVLYELREHANLLFSAGDFLIVRPNTASGLAAQMDYSASVWEANGGDAFFLYVPPDEVVLGFMNGDPVRRDEVKASWIVNVQPGGCYNLSVDVRDFYDVSEFPNRVCHRLLVDGRVVWEHDVSGDANASWRPIRLEVHPTGDTLIVIASVLAVGDPEKGWDWGAASRMAIRGTSIGECSSAP